MAKRARHQPDFYASLLDDVHHRGLSDKYRPKQNPFPAIVVGGGVLHVIITRASFKISQPFCRPGFDSQICRGFQKTAF